MRPDEQGYKQRRGRDQLNRSPHGFVWHSNSTLGVFNQGTKEFARRFIIVDRSLGVPLHGQDEMIGCSSFHRLDDAVIGAASHDTQSFADRIGGLMMGRIHWHGYRTVLG
jgi:hypothetical protein